MSQTRKILAGLVIALSVLAVSGEQTTAQTRQRNAWYAGLSLGGNFLAHNDISGVVFVPGDFGPFRFDTHSGFAVGGSVGYTFPFGLNVEGEVAFRRNSVDTVLEPNDELGVGGPVIAADGRVHSIALMLNGIYDIRFGDLMGGKLVPYVGAGVGLALVSANIDANFFGLGINLTDDSDVAFAYQFIFGAKYMLSPKVSLGVEYRGMGITETSFDANAAAFGAGARFEADGYWNHTVMLRLNWRFSWTR